MMLRQRDINKAWAIASERLALDIEEGIDVYDPEWEYSVLAEYESMPVRRRVFRVNPDDGLLYLHRLVFVQAANAGQVTS